MFFVKGVTRKYNKEVGEQTRALLKTAVKMAKMKNRLKFLLNCRRCKLVPRCLNYRVNVTLHSSVSYQELRNVENRQKIRIISIVISDTKRTMEHLKRTKDHLSEKVRLAVWDEDWRKIHAQVEQKTANVFNKTRLREIRKVDSLKKKKIGEINQRPEWIENTTNCEIPDYLERTLLLGPNYNIQNKASIPYVPLLADVETAIRNKPEADDIRAEVSTIVSNFINYQLQPRTKKNEWIHTDITRSRKFLRERPDLYVTRADKGNKTVVMSAIEYNQKMLNLVSDTTTYRRLKDNPTNRTLKKLNRLVEQWWVDKHIDTITKNRLKVFNCHPPRIYGLPKIHKENRPIRPIVSTIGSATYRMAKFLTEILNKLVGKSEHHVRNSFEFAEEIGKVRVPEGCVLYSLDVVSLYTNIPVEKVYECVEERWNELHNATTIPWTSFKQAMKTVLEASFFQYNGTFYDQIFGVPMGSPLSPVVANLVMESLENDVIKKLQEC